jgi:hypothetical protein
VFTSSSILTAEILAMSASGHGSGSDDEVELDFDFSDLPKGNATPPAQVIQREDATSILDSKKLILKAGE